VYEAITFGFGNLQDIRDFFYIDGGVDPCSDAYKYSSYAGNALGIGTGIGIVGKSLRVQMNLLSKGNVFKITSGRLRTGFRVDPAHHGKPWGHRHFWRW
jgi:hypothetical protein